MLWISISVFSAWWSCLPWVPTQRLERCTWRPPVGFSPPQPLSSLVTKWLPSCVFGCMRRVLWRGEHRNKSVVSWAGGSSSGHAYLGRWQQFTCPGRHDWLHACLHAVLSQNTTWQCHPCYSLPSVSGVGILYPQATPELKKCHSLCIKEFLMLTDDSPLGRSERYCMPAEDKGLCYWFLYQGKRSLLPEKLRGGNKNVSAHAGFKDIIALRVRKGLLFGKYPLH